MSNSEIINRTLSIRSSKVRNNAKNRRNLPPNPITPRERPINAAQMLAFGHQLAKAIEAGVDPKELAREFGISVTRMNQFVDLTFLAPDIQEEILGMTRKKGERAITEHELRKVGRTMVWEEQRKSWAQLKGKTIDPSSGPA